MSVNSEQPSLVTSPHARVPTELACDLDSDARRGLGRAAAAARLVEFGANRFSAARRPAYAAIVVRQIADPLVTLLIVAAALSYAIGERLEAAVIAAIVVLNGLLGFFQEAGAERAILSLRERVQRTAAVVRDGREHEVGVEELVPGDLVVLREGDRVPADGRLVAAERLKIDESALTGESLPVAKNLDAVDRAAPLAERSSMVFAGTGVSRGRGRMFVTATGVRTEIGTIASLAATAKPPPTPLQQRLGRLSRTLAVVGVGLTVFLTLAMVGRGSSFDEAFLVGIAVAVAAVPEGLAATVTIALAQAAREMAGCGAIVRRLAAVETLGAATLIAADKTGTLTVNQLRLATMHPAGGHSEADVLEVGTLASTAELFGPGGDVRVAGDPVDGAFLLALAATGAHDPRTAAGRERVIELPFDPWRKRQTSVYRENGRLHVAVKGAPEVLAARSLLGDDERRQLSEHASEWAAEGLRVLAVGERSLDHPLPAEEEIDTELELIGLVGLRDPLRETAADSIRQARTAGIGVAMLTGDHPATAAAIARMLELGAGDPLSGRELERMDATELRDAVTDHAVFARVTPADKLRLVEAFQDAGHVVAVTGDGINDAPALRRADVGVAMGGSGTETAREAAGIVLTDDDFATIVQAIREGRRLGDNIRKFVAFLLSANLGEVVLFAIAVLVGLGPPLTVVQVLTVNLLTDGMPAVALARDPASAHVMRRRPQGVGTLFSKRLRNLLALAGIAVGLAATAAFVVGRELAPETAQTMAFATLVLAELVLVFSIRSSHLPAWRGPRNTALGGSVLVSAVFLVAVVAVPLLREPFGTQALTPVELPVVAVLAIFPAGLVEAVKAGGRRSSSTR